MSGPRFEVVMHPGQPYESVWSEHRTREDAERECDEQRAEVERGFRGDAFTRPLTHLMYEVREIDPE